MKQRDTLFVVALIAGLYFFSRSGRSLGAPPRPGPSGSTSPGGGTTITIPGVGTYINRPGGGVSVQMDPHLFDGYGQTPDTYTPPSIAYPNVVPDYQTADMITAPVDVFPYNYGGYYGV